MDEVCSVLTLWLHFSLPSTLTGCITLTICFVILSVLDLVLHLNTFTNNFQVFFNSLFIYFGDTYGLSLFLGHFIELLLFSLATSLFLPEGH